jgi:hypothetical protein
MGIEFKAVLVVGYVREVDDFLSWTKADCDREHGGDAEAYVGAHLRSIQDLPIVVERLGNHMTGDFVLAAYLKEENPEEGVFPGGISIARLLTPKKLGDLERLGEALRDFGFSPGPLAVHAISNIF